MNNHHDAEWMKNRDFFNRHKRFPRPGELLNTNPLRIIRVNNPPVFNVNIFPPEKEDEPKLVLHQIMKTKYL